MVQSRIIAVSITALCSLSACVTQPTGPMVAVMPAPNKPFEVFRADEVACRQYASQQVAGQADQANERAVGAAALGTALGAGLGAAAGGGSGAAIGAGAGAVVGTATASGPASNSQYGLQRRYDIAYSQCMYAHGNQVPGYYVITTPPPPPPPSGVLPRS